MDPFGRPERAMPRKTKHQLYTILHLKELQEGNVLFVFFFVFFLRKEDRIPFYTLFTNYSVLLSTTSSWVGEEDAMFWKPIISLKHFER